MTSARPGRVLALTLTFIGVGTAALWASVALNAADTETIDSDGGDEADGWQPPAAVQERQRAIEEESAALGGDHPWAGAYYDGDGLGANRRWLLAPSNGVAVTWHGCLGLYGFNEGSIHAQPGGSLRFGFQWPNEPGGFQQFSEEVVPVRWGERRYLIAGDRLVEFVNAINHGREPRSEPRGSFPLRVGDETKPVSGLPNLSAQMQRLIRATPVEAAIVAVEEIASRSTELSCDRRYRVRLDRGALDGLAVGLEMKVVAPRKIWDDVFLVEVGSRTSVGVLDMSASLCDQVEAPAAGWHLSSGAYPANEDADGASCD